MSILDKSINIILEVVISSIAIIDNYKIKQVMIREIIKEISSIDQYLQK